jgi:hypothetical protein
MTDSMFLPIWIVLSWLIKQVESGIEEEPDEEEGIGGNATGVETGTELAGPEVDPGEVYEPIVQLIKIGIGAFSLLLLGLSISAYRKTALKGIIYAAVAFGLFAAQLFFDYLEDAVEGWAQPFNDVIFYAMTLAILVLFFLAVVRRNKT